MLYLLMYDFVDDYLERRAAHRAVHIELCKEAVARGELLAGGAVGNPPESGLLLFAGAAGHAEKFAAADPYVLNGLVTRWQVKPWTTVVGIAELVPNPL
ncbi:YciI-like protein [Herbaspirillum robiniae]|uniref:YciI-like protein n=1 Tax=Herbaspirillum robiniae TaxID=2014887 RepID=UPI003D76AB66